MKKIIFLFICSFSLGITLAQEAEQTKRDSLANSAANSDALAYLGISRPLGAVEFDIRYEGLKGHPFLYKEWYPASFKIAGKHYQEAKAEFRINLGRKEIQMRLTESYAVSLPLDRIEKLWLNKDDKKVPFLIKTLSFQKQSPTVFLLEILKEGDYTLYKLHHKIFKQADFMNSNSYADISTQDEFKSEKAYYLSSPDGRFEKIKLKKKSITRKFPALTSYLNQNFDKKKAAANAEEEIIRLLDSINNQ